MPSAGAHTSSSDDLMCHADAMLGWVRKLVCWTAHQVTLSPGWANLWWSVNGRIRGVLHGIWRQSVQRSSD